MTEGRRGADRAAFLASLRALASGHGNPWRVKVYTLGFTLVVTAVFAGAVSSLDASLRTRARVNAERARQRVLLELLGLCDRGDTLASRQVAQLFGEGVLTIPGESPSAGGAAVRLECYRKRGEASPLVAFPISGQGFWGVIEGFLAVDEIRGTIEGISFTRHEETPGLGGRISEAWFRDQFVGKRYTGALADGRRIRVVAGGIRDSERDVDAITGATGTSRGVEALVNASIERFLATARRDET